MKYKIWMIYHSPNRTITRFNGKKIIWLYYIIQKWDFYNHLIENWKTFNYFCLSNLTANNSWYLSYHSLFKLSFSFKRDIVKLFLCITLRLCAFNCFRQRILWFFIITNHFIHQCSIKIRITKWVCTVQ